MKARYTLLPIGADLPAVRSDRLMGAVLQKYVILWFLIFICCCSCWSQTYSPGTDTNLCMWFKADALGLTNNAPVSIWSPSGGSVASSLGQSSVTNQPIFYTAQQNGLPAVLFDGVSSYLTNWTTYSPATTQPLTIFLVYKFTGPENNGYIPTFIGNNYSGGAWSIGEYASGIAAYFGKMGTAIPTDPNWHMIMLVINGANSKYRIDGGTDILFTNNPGMNYINSLEVGAQANNAWTRANVYVGEILLYNGDQSANETAIFNYLESRWAIIELEANPPFTFHWADRRPIGMDGLAGSLWPTPKNPRGWFGSNAVDITTTRGLAAFYARLLTRASNEVSILTNMNAQGIIFWDLEGEEIRTMCFNGDPRKIPILAPEMDAIADQFISIYTSAGLRVGMCLRAHTFGAGGILPIGTNGQVFVLTNAPFGQKAYYYTNGWLQTTNAYLLDQITAQSYSSELMEKIQYANTRWGCTLFYIDSFPDLDHDGPFSVSALTNILNSFPGILLIPEVGATYLEATKLFAMSAPYLVPSDTGYFLPTNVSPIYPNAAGVININSAYTNIATLMASIQAGNIFMANSWYPNKGTSNLHQAYFGAVLLPPTDLHVVSTPP